MISKQLNKEVSWWSLEILEILASLKDIAIEIFPEAGVKVLK